MNKEAKNWFNLARTTQAIIESREDLSWENFDEMLYEAMTAFDIAETNDFRDFMKKNCQIAL